MLAHGFGELIRAETDGNDEQCMRLRVHAPCILGPAAPELGRRRESCKITSGACRDRTGDLRLAKRGG